MSGRSSLILLVALALLVAVPSVAATQEKSEDRSEKPAEADKKPSKESKGKTAKKAQEQDDVPTFTTRDLRAKYGPSKPAPKKDPAAGGKAALERMQADRAAAEDAAAKRTEAQKKVAEAQAAVTRLEEQLRRMRNPFLGKPELSAEQREKLKGLDQAERIRRTETALEEARAELAAARKELAALS